MDNIVPFGKYKGQPVEVLRSDRQYLDWLVGQDWFRAKFAGLHTLIVNNFAEPTETPEHNAMQARFLDEGLVAKLYDLVLPGTREKDWQSAMQFNRDKIQRFEKEAARRSSGLERAEGWYGWSTAEITDELETAKTRLAFLEHRGLQPLCISFEVDGADLAITIAEPDHERSRTVVQVELKPALGDDYPAVMRQIKANSPSQAEQRRRNGKHYSGWYIDYWPALVIGQYVGTGATLAEVVAMFAASDIRVVMMSELAEP